MSRAGAFACSHVLDVPEEGCKNGNEPITPAMLGIDVGTDPEPEPE